MQHTTNYNLNKPETSDYIESASRVALNSNFDTIDATLKTLNDRTTPNASTSTVGGFKCYYDSTNAILYLTNNGTDPTP